MAAATMRATGQATRLGLVPRWPWGVQRARLLFYLSPSHAATLATATATAAMDGGVWLLSTDGAVRWMAMGGAGGDAIMREDRRGWIGGVQARAVNWP